MTDISRRTTVRAFLGAGISLAAFGCTQQQSAPPAAAPPAAAAPPPAAPAAPFPPQAAGGELRRAFTPSDIALYRDCINKTMRAPVNRVWRWSNPESGNSGSMAAITPPEAAAGQTCRSFRETITLKDGRTDTIIGRACQKADGSWDISA